MSEYNIVQDTIYHNNEKIAYLNLIEWEYFNGKLVQEISVVQFNQSEQHKTIKLISFIHKKHDTLVFFAALKFTNIDEVILNKYIV